MTTGLTLAITGLAAGVTVFALGVSGRREEGDDIYSDDDTVHLNLEIGDRVFLLELEPRSDHDHKRAKGVLRARNGRGDFIKGDVDESTFVRINHWIRCQVD